MNKKIAMMGGKNSILPFKGLGIDIYPVDDLEEAATAAGNGRRLWGDLLDRAID